MAIALILWEEGCLAEQNGEYGAAKARFSESLAIGLPYWWAHALPTLGWALIGLGELDEAHAYFQGVCTAAAAQERLPISLDAQAGLATIAALRSSPGPPYVAEGIKLTAELFSVLQAVSQHPAATQETRDRIARLVNEFDAHAPVKVSSA